MKKSALLVPVLAVLLFSCGGKPIRIGFIGPMTGSSSNIGVEGLKGFSLAVAERNAAGGVLGRRLELVSKDDRGSPDACLEALEELYAQGIRIVVMHTTSGAGVDAFAWSADKDLLLLTHTMSAPVYAGKDDRLLKFVGSIDSFGLAMGKFARGRGIRSIYVAVDGRNAEYGEAILSGFKIGAADPEIRARESLSGTWSHQDLAGRTVDSGADALLLVAPGIDAAKVAQQLSGLGYGGLLLLSAWSQDKNLLSYSGNFGHRIFMPSTFNPDSTEPEYQEFHAKYLGLYNENPVMSAVYGYETAIFLFQGLEEARTTDPAKLRTAMLKIPRYRGLQAEFSLDEHGDAEGDYLILTIDKGGLSFVSAVGPEQP